MKQITVRIASRIVHLCLVLAPMAVWNAEMISWRHLLYQYYCTSVQAWLHYGSMWLDTWWRQMAARDYNCSICFLILHNSTLAAIGSRDSLLLEVPTIIEDHPPGEQMEWCSSIDLIHAFAILDPERGWARKSFPPKVTVTQHEKIYSRVKF